MSADRPAGDARRGDRATPRALLETLARALGAADPAAAAAAVWPLLGGRTLGQVGDVAGLARLLGNDRHRPLLAARAYAVADVDERANAARAELRVTPADGGAPHGWLVAMTRGPDGGWRVTGLQRDGFDA